MFKRIISAALVFGAVSTAPPVMAQPTCGQRDDLTAQLSQRFMEQLTAGGLQNASNVVEIWTSPENGTWTMLLSHPDGISCVVGSGTSWETLTIKPEPKGLPS